jgi:hypothetical protein
MRVGPQRTSSITFVALATAASIAAWAAADLVISAQAAGGACVTPWGNRVVPNGQTVTREPYFTNGSYSFAVANIMYLCSNGAWTLLDGRTPVPGAQRK